MDPRGGLFADPVDAIEHGGVGVVNALGEVAAVVEQQVCFPGGAVLHDGLLDAPPIFLFRLALPGKDGDACSGDGCGGVVLGGENVAGAPAHFGAEGHEGLDEHGRLHGHVDTANDPGAGEGRAFGVAAA